MASFLAQKVLRFRRLFMPAEWILNPRQVQRLANMIGVSRDALKSMMGFYGGGAAGFQGGTGDLAAEDIDILTPKMLKGISDRSIKRLITRLEKIGGVIDKAAAGLGNVDIWDTYIDRVSKRLGRLGRRIKQADEKADRERGVRGFIESMDRLLSDTGPFAKLRESIERRIGRRARQLQRQQLSVSGPRGDTTVTRGTNIVAIAQRQLDEEQRQRPQLLDERADTRRALAQVRARQRRKGLSDAAKSRLQTEENQLIGMLDESRQRVVDNLEAIATAQEALDQAIIEAAREEESRRFMMQQIRSMLVPKERLASLISEAVLLMLLERAGGRQVAAGQRVGQARERGGVLGTQLAELEALKSRAVQEGNTEAVADLELQIEELGATLLRILRRCKN